MVAILNFYSLEKSEVVAESFFKNLADIFVDSKFLNFDDFIADLCNEFGGKYLQSCSYLSERRIEFPSEEQKLAFLLKWG